jgi:hypothetical protein
MAIPHLFLVHAVFTVCNFNRFSCDSSWEQLFHCITDLELLSIHAQSTRSHAHLVADGQSMAGPSAFSFPCRRPCTKFQQLFDSFSCKTQLGTSFICIPNLDSFFLGAHWTRLHSHLVANGQSMMISSLFACPVLNGHSNFNRFSCDSSWEQLFHCIADYECLLFHVQLTRLHALLVANGQRMMRPYAFSCPYRHCCAQFQQLF